MVQLRGGSSRTRRTTRLGDEEIAVPLTRKSTRGSKKRCGKRKRTDQTEQQPTTLPRFINDDTRDKYEWISQKDFITRRTIIPSEFRKLDLDSVLKLFEF